MTEDNWSLLAQIIVYVISPLATLLAVWVAYLAVHRSSQPQLLIYYQPNPDVSSVIDLVIENIGGGSALEVAFSEPLPIDCWGIEKAEGEGAFVPKEGFPALSAGQRYTFNGGQFSGLQSKVGKGLVVKVTFKYRNPLGFRRRARETILLGIEHLKRMPTRTSAAQAIVDALKGPNRTTMHEIRDELRAIRKHLSVLTKDHQNKEQESELG